MKKIISVFLITVLFSVLAFAQNESTNELKSGYLDIGNAKIYYEEKGDGIPLIMIHGGFLDRRMWDEQFEYFSKDYRAIRYDVRNHGLTASAEDVYTNYGDLNALMDSLKIKKAVVMGLSMGGLIAIDFTLAFPDKVIALIPVSSGISGFDKKDELWKQFDKNINIEFSNNNAKGAIDLMLKIWTFGPGRTTGDVNKNVTDKVKLMLQNTFDKPDTMRIAGKLSPSANGRLSEIKVPVLAIYGDKDLQGIIDIANRIESEVKGSKKVVIKDAAHMVNMEYPDLFNETVANYLKDIVRDIKTSNAEKLISENKENSDFMIIDVRTPEEYSNGFIKGAENIDIKSIDFANNIDKLDKKKTYLIYCKSGGRSSKAFEVMKSKGFANVYNMLGGITKWTNEKREIIIK